MPDSMSDAMSDDAPPSTIPELSPDATGLSDAELKTLIDRARATGDAELRRLITSYLTLRRVTADVVEFLITREGGVLVERTPLIALARRLARRSAT